MKFFGIIVGLLLMVWYVPAMVWGVQITSAINGFQNGDASAMEGLMDGPAPLAWWRNRTELQETFDPAELNRRRLVNIEMKVPFDELLAEGEAAPADDLRDLYAMARATSRIHPFCATLLDGLATRCDISGAKGRVLKDGTAVIEGDLLYAPAYDMGDPSSVQGGDVFTGSARLTGSGDIEATPEGLTEAVSRALTVCDAVREVYGTCVVARLSVNAGSFGGRTTVTARFAVFANKSQHNRETVDATVERVAETSLGATQ